MTNTKNILQPLFDMGLSKYEAKVYLTLVSAGTSTAKSVSDITGIPYGKVYEIINTLSNKGFAMTLPSKPMKYRAISPQQAIISVKKEISDKFKRIENNLLKQLEPLFAKNKNFNQSKSSFLVVNGRSNVVNKTEELIKKAKKNINIQCSANTLSRLLLFKESLKEAHDRGISISIAGVVNKENLQEIKSLNFCNIKHINNSRSKFVSVDGKESLVITPVPDDDNILYGRDLGILALSSSFTKFLDNFFESDFKKARKIYLD